MMKLTGSLVKTPRRSHSYETGKKYRSTYIRSDPSAVRGYIRVEPVALAVTPRWIPTGNLNIPRSGHTATLLRNGKVLVVGGDSSGSAELYDPVIGSWNFTGSLNKPPGGHTATLLPTGKVLVVGDFSDHAELYDPATETWTVTGALNERPRPGHTATLLPDGQVLVVAGGEPDIGGNILATAELHDPSSGMWRIAGSLNTARIGHTTALLPDGMVLVAGGWGAVFRSQNFAQFGVLSGAELYERATGTSFVYSQPQHTSHGSHGDQVAERQSFGCWRRD